MTTPNDKIYVSLYGWNNNPTEDRDDEVVYIRQDALLDWLKARLKENEEWREVCPDDRFFGGEEVAYDYVIEMINKL